MKGYSAFRKKIKNRKHLMKNLEVGINQPNFLFNSKVEYN